MCSAKIKINGRLFDLQEDESLLQVATRNGFYIPTLCNHEAVEAYGACRLCLVEVSQGSWSKVTTACNFPAQKGLEVKLDTPEVERHRKVVLELLLARCPGSEELRELAAEFGVTGTRFGLREEADDCILCGLCTRSCETVGATAISAVGRGYQKRIGTPFDASPEECIGCATCASVCPMSCIEVVDTDTTRSIWGRTFKMVACETCGQPVMPRAQYDFLRERRPDIPEYYYDNCPACQRAAVAETIASVMV